MRQISISIFFPAFNEEQNVVSMVERTVGVAEECPYIGAYEILIIDDGSTDATPRIADELAARFRTVRAIHHPVNAGYGAALKTGFHEARMDYVFFTDADMQFDLLEIEHLLIHISDYHVVVGYRAPRRDPLMRMLNAAGWNVLNRMLFGLHVRDIDCAFKLFERAIIERIPIVSDGAMVNAELLVRLRREGVDIKEVPVSHLPRVYGSPTGAKFSVIIRALRELLLLYAGELGARSREQVAKLLMVGVLNTIVDVSAYLLLTRLLMGPFTQAPVAAKFFAFLLGTMTSLFFNRSWTFGMRSRLTIPEIVRFYVNIFPAIFANVFLMYLFVSVLGLYDLSALVLSTALTFILNLLLTRRWVLAHRNHPPLAQPIKI